MVRGGVGGGNTQTGIHFEGRVDIVTYLNTQVEGYECAVNPPIRGKTMGYTIKYNNQEVASSYKKKELYRFLERQGVNWNTILSKQLLPDNSIYVVNNNTIFIIEIKYQQTSGSIDEKLQTCGFKLFQYRRLFSALNYEVQYLYILNDWYRDTRYRDTLTYIISQGCSYYFEYLPLDRLGLPVPDAN